MIILCNYTEYGSDNGISMRDYFEERPYPGMDKIVSYLRNNGKATLASTAPLRDRFTNERMKGEYQLVVYDDGIYSWWSDLAYYVEKYNLRLPKEFEDYVLSQDQKAV